MSYNCALVTALSSWLLLFDRNGGTTAGSVTIYRVVDGKPKLVGLITPSPALVR